MSAGLEDWQQGLQIPGTSIHDAVDEKGGGALHSTAYSPIHVLLDQWKMSLSRKVARNLFTVLIMLAVGFAVGFRPHGSVPEFLLAMLVIIGFSFAFSWISALIGISVGSVEAAQSGGFIWMFPLTFASSAFVPVASMPSWLQPFAEHNPVSVVANSLRGLFHVDPSLTAADTRLALIQSGAWIVGILLVFVPLAVARYRRATRG